MTDNIFMAILSKIKKIKTQVESVDNSVNEIKTLFPTDYATQSSINDIKAAIDDLSSDGSSGDAVSHGVAEFTTAGIHTWTCPSGVKWVTALMASGSGGGGGCYYYSILKDTYYGNGGCAGNIWIGVIPVIPGEIYTLTVGSGGSKGTSGSGSPDSATNGGDGGATVFADMVTLIGGKGGLKGYNNVSKNDILNVRASIGYKVRTIELLIGNSGLGVDSDGDWVGTGGAITTTTERYLGFSNTAGGKGSNSSSSSNAGAGKAGKIVLIW